MNIGATIYNLLLLHQATITQRHPITDQLQQLQKCQQKGSGAIACNQAVVQLTLWAYGSH